MSIAFTAVAVDSYGCRFRHWDSVGKAYVVLQCNHLRAPAFGDCSGTESAVAVGDIARRGGESSELVAAESAADTLPTL